MSLRDAARRRPPGPRWRHDRRHHHRERHLPPLRRAAGQGLTRRSPHAPLRRAPRRKRSALMGECHPSTDRRNAIVRVHASFAAASL
jgi:hypothetical protein